MTVAVCWEHIPHPEGDIMLFDTLLSDCESTSNINS